MNFQDKKFQKVLSFVAKAVFISAIFIFTYHLTIGIAIKNITDVVYSAYDKVEAIDLLIQRSGIDNLVSPNKLSEFDDLKLRKNTKILLENLTPVIDEILLHDFYSREVP